MSLDRPDRPEEAETLFAAWAVRAEAGEDVRIEDLLGAHPEHKEALTRLHEDWKLFAPLLGRAVPGKISEASGIVLAPITSHGKGEVEGPSPELIERLGINIPDSGRYRFRAVLGRGGGGVVLKVWDTKLNRALAMKVVLGRDEERPDGSTPRVDSRTLSRFVDEARIASQLNHPGIVPVHELGTDESGRAFFTMKLVKGEDLSKIFEHVKTGHDGWNQTRALNVLLRVCESLAFAHERGVIHRDLKPANIMVGRHGEVYVMDWGLARVLGEEDKRDVRVKAPPKSSALLTVRKGRPDSDADSPLYTMDGDVVGTPAYMAPEQAAGRLDLMGPRSDVYAVGAMLYHLLVGHMPYVPEGVRLNNYAVWQRVQEGPPAPIAERSREHPVELAAICERAMARNPEGRYSGVLELAQDLRAYLEQRVVGAYETGTWAETRKWVRRNKALAGALAAAMLFLLGGIKVSTDIAVYKARGEQQAHYAKAIGYVTAITGAQSTLRANEPGNVRRALNAAPTDLRGWEWNYLSAEMDKSLFSLHAELTASGDMNGIGQFAYSSTGDCIATVATNGSVDVWSADDGRHLRTLVGAIDPDMPAARAHPNGCVAFSPDGQLVATASSADGVAIWRVQDGLCERRIGAISSLESITDCAFSPDGSSLMLHANDQLVLYSVATGQLLCSVRSPRGGIHHTEFSHDGSMVLAGSGSESVFVWDARNGALMFDLRGTEVAVPFATFSPDDSVVVACSWQGASVWDTRTGDFITALDSGGSAVNCAAFSPDRTQIVTATMDQVVHVWDSETYKQVGSLSGHSDGVSWVAYSPDGKFIVTASDDSSVRVWDSQSLMARAELWGHEGGPATFAQFGSDGDHILSAGGGNKLLSWSLSASLRKRLVRPVHDEGWWESGALSARFSYNSNRLIAANGRNIAVYDNSISEPLLYLIGHTDSIWDVEFSPDDQCIVTASEDGSARIWDGVLGTELQTLKVPGWIVTSAKFNADGSRVLTASSDGYVRVWEVESGTCIQTIECEGVWCAVYSPDGKLIATAGSDIRLWQPRSSDPIAVMGVNSGHFRRVAFSPDGTRLVTGSSDGNAYVWSVVGTDADHVLIGHGGEVWDACFSPDGTRVVTASVDGSLRVWDAASGQELVKLESGGSWLASVSFCADGSRIVAAALDQSMLVFDAVHVRTRRDESQRLLDAQVAARQLLKKTLIGAVVLNDSLVQFRAEKSPDPWVVRATLNEFSRCAEAGRAKSASLRAKRQERTWLEQLLGTVPWPNEQDIATAVRAEPGLPQDGDALNHMAWQLVDPEDTHHGSVMRALVLARLAIEEGRVYEWAARDTLARSLMLLGRFDEALAEQARALALAPRAAKVEYESRLRSLEVEIALLRDGSGHLRELEIKSRMQILEKEIATLEKDADVRLWLGNSR